MGTPLPAELIDLERYPVTELESARGRDLVAAARAELASAGMAALPGFLRARWLEPLVHECDGLAALGHFSEVRGTPYIEPPDPTLAPDHPRNTAARTALTAVAYDLFPKDSLQRALYEWDPLMEFFRVLLQKPALYRYADPFGALNLSVMRAGDELAWHYDQTDFVVSIAFTTGEAGGDFEVAPLIRSSANENYDAVQRVLAEKPGAGVRTIPMTPGTLLLFQGRHSIHRVSPVRGERPRYVALLAYDTKPGTDSSPLLKAVRYGRQPAQ